jgi:hypothetical protein
MTRTATRQHAMRNSSTEERSKRNSVCPRWRGATSNSARDIASWINVRTGGRVHNPSVEISENEVLVSGRVRSPDVRKLAAVAALEAVRELLLPDGMKLDVRVLPTHGWLHAELQASPSTSQEVSEWSEFETDSAQLDGEAWEEGVELSPSHSLALC